MKIFLFTRIITYTLPFSLSLYGYKNFRLYNYQTQIRPNSFDFSLDKPEDFFHPYIKKPWYIHSILRISRLLYLGLIFFPLTVMSTIIFFLRIGIVRKFWLHLLISTIERAGCTFQKFGQWLSMRPDMFPKDVIDALSGLRSKAPKHSFSHTRKEIRNSFGKEIKDFFEDFSLKPVASGSIAQVHQAKLKLEYAINGQVDVAVKVRHPNVFYETFTDLEFVFEFIQRSVNLMRITIPFKYEEFRETMQQQIDFNWEAFNLMKFGFLFQKEKEINFPKVFKDIMSSSVLTETWMYGKPVVYMLESFGRKFKEMEIEDKKIDKLVRKQKIKLAEIIHDMCMKMFLRDNFMHGDLHGGNILICDDGSLAVLDTGITTTILDEINLKFRKFLHGLTVGDYESLTKSLLDFHKGQLHNIDIKGFSNKMKQTVKKYVGYPGRNPEGGMVDLGDMLGEIMLNLQYFGVFLRSDVATSIQSMSISEGLIRMLNPEYDVCLRSLPYFVQYELDYK